MLLMLKVIVLVVLTFYDTYYVFLSIPWSILVRGKIHFRITLSY
jgi:hypothetical protein